MAPMKKMRLDVEELAVESFEPERISRGRGTVNGHAQHTDPKVCLPSANWYCSVGDGCTWGVYTCAITCDPECYSDGDNTCTNC